ncbi:Thiol-disulfide oxidoreductase ResA [bacterium HR17]|jgi:thiol-disulfide isomerase/thioredoxin|uniref:Thiol-disulfide oxidoreductase ResA n=1 Tax=Candidatus Fervidibacter japonicus TaxID=2035412 RepID=A0A2H5XAH8_9BACT|nr:Thiol-disulfide oxidoreductase ResA [bacterium HR17]
MSHTYLFRFWTLVVTAMFAFCAGAALKEGKTIPSFQTPLLDGKTASVAVEKGRLTMRLKDRKGNTTLQPKVLVLDFWATWCGPCHVASKWLTQLYQRYRGKGLVVLGISIDEDGRASVAPFVREHRTPYLVGLDPKATVANRFLIEGLPTIYVVNSKGVIVATFEGLPDDPKALEKAIQQAGLR